MMFMANMKKTFLACALSMGFAFADAIDVATISMGGFWTRDDQLRDIGDMLLFGQGSFFDIGLTYTPVSTQLPLKSKYGEHEGFAFRHHIAGMSSYPLNENSFMSAMLWFERSGWDGEDFLLFPQYTDFGLVRSVTTWGLAYTNAKMDYSVAAGMQHQNVEFVGDVYPRENDSLLYTWANLRFGRISAQAQFHRTHFRQLRLALNLEDRAVFGGASSGLWTYMPNIDATFYKRELDGFDDDFVRVNWEQNLWAQQFSAEVSYDFPDDGFHSAALKFYPDPSRFFALEFTCLRRRAVADDWDDLMFGWAVDLAILRIGYNAANEYDHLFHARGTWIAEIHFNIESLNDMLFAKKGRHAVPLETKQIKKKNTPDKPAETIPLTGKAGESEAPVKTITAKGVRYEKAGSEGGAK